ncbi:MAG TPA: IS3 family transposase [Ktedonobacteraceae bacterium]|nr:IS3 family transposase [Ktedonobacteraceae bacterium]
MKYQFIEEQRGEYPISVLCETLEVSVSGYHAWRKRPVSQHDREDAYLADQVKVAFHANRQVYGSPRLHAELRAQGIRCGQKRVARLMRAQELAAQRPRHRTITMQSDPEVTVAPNLLQRDFSAEQPNTKWVADTTYIWTAEGWLYLAVVLDVFSRMVVGWSMAAIQDATLVTQASLDASQKRGCSITRIVEVRTRAGAIKHFCNRKQ